VGRSITVNECTGPVTTFIVEPFMPHKEEMYMSIQVCPPRLPSDVRTALHKNRVMMWGRITRFSSTHAHVQLLPHHVRLSTLVTFFSCGSKQHLNSGLQWPLAVLASFL